MKKESRMKYLTRIECMTANSVTPENRIEGWLNDFSKRHPQGNFEKIEIHLNNIVIIYSEGVEEA
jgi:hypothetical protein